MTSPAVVFGVVGFGDGGVSEYESIDSGDDDPGDKIFDASAKRSAERATVASTFSRVEMAATHWSDGRKVGSSALALD